MSETVMYKGKLTEVKPDKGETLEDLARRIIIETRGTTDSKPHYESYIEQLDDDIDGVYLEACGKIFFYTREEYEDTDDIFDVVDKGGGEFEFTVKYYNGGCSFNEAIEEGLKRLE